MEIKWYWLAEQLELVKNTSHLYNDGHTYYEVSARVGDFFQALIISVIFVLFSLGFLICFFTTLKRREKTGKLIVRWCVAVLLVYALLLAIGVGPYIQFYPQGSGFLDFSILEHILEGLYFAFLALIMFLGGRLGQFIARKGFMRVK